MSVVPFCIGAAKCPVVVAMTLRRVNTGAGRAQLILVRRFQTLTSTLFPDSAPAPHGA
jgi:hypothetical protein